MTGIEIKVSILVKIDRYILFYIIYYYDKYMQICISSVEYTVPRDGKNPIIHIFGRDEIRKPRHIKVIDYKPYFWCSTKTVNKLPKFKHDGSPDTNYFVSDEYGVSIRGEPLTKIYVDSPYDIKKYAEYVENYEADISYSTKFMIDMGIKSGIEIPDGKHICSISEISPCKFDIPFRVWFADIECLDENGFPKPERDQITCITVYDNYTDHYTTYYMLADPSIIEFPAPMETGCFNPMKHTIKPFVTEEAMMYQFISDLKKDDPDVLSGWNFKDFDIDYIIRRLETLKISPQQLSRIPGSKIDKNSVKGRTIFDLLEGYKKLHPTKLESYRLDYVSEVELNEHKVEYTGTLGNLWRNDVAHMVQYNMQDVRLCVRLNDKDKIIPFFTEISRYIGCQFGNTLYSSRVVDVYVLNIAKGRYILPTRKVKQDGEDTTFMGATVLPPSQNHKVRSFVGVVDLASLYPSSLMSLNMSMETKVTDKSIPDSECNISPLGIRFRKKPDGLTTEILSTLMKERKDKKNERNKYPFDSDEYNLLDMQQSVVKVIMNTYYGVSGNQSFRLNDFEIAASTTAVGREVIQFTKDFITQNYGYEVIYGDTDSCFIQMPEDKNLEENIELGIQMADALNAAYPRFCKEKFNSDTCHFSIKFEKIYGRFFQGDAKKRYAGIILWKEGVFVENPDGTRGELSISGFELKRSDSSKITQKVQETVFNMLLGDSTKDDVQKYVKNIVSDFRSGNLPLEEIGIPNALSRDIEEYEGAAASRMQVRAAKWANDNLGTNFRSGSKPKRIFVKWVNPKYAQTDVVLFEHDYDINKEDFIIDYKLMCEKEVKQPLERIFNSLDWKWEEFDPDIAPIQSLDAWF